AFADWANGDYRLAPASPAINAGNGTYYTEAGGSLSADTCLGGLPRLLGAAIDIGAVEYPVTIGPDETNILYVNKNVSGLVGDGSSWETAMPELADALKWAKEKYEADNTVFDTEPLKIYVAKGTYKPMYNPADNNFGNSDGRNNSFLLVNNVQLYGGFAGTETGLNGTEADLAARDFETNNTILSGDLDNNDGVDGAINGENAYHVVVSAAAVGNALLDGFVISGGNADGESMSLTVNEQSVYSDFGGGMYNVSSSPVLTNGTVSGNRAVSGGGMYNHVGSSPELINVTVSGNRAFNGGGMYNFSNSSPVLTNVTISGNRAYDGGGVSNEDSSPVLTNVTVSGNRADNDGGGMFNWNSSPVLTNVTISGNRATSRGGAMYKNASLPSTTLY